MVFSGKQYEISSLTNDKVKLINSLYHRKYRRDLNLFVAEGVRICKEALDNNWEIKYLLFSKENKEGSMVRTYYELPITLPKIDIMALTWTLVHKIDKESPFWEKTKEDIIKQHPEFLIFVNGFDEIYSERTRARKSYVVDDIIWNKNFATNFKSLENGKLIMDVRDLNNVIDE